MGLVQGIREFDGNGDGQRFSNKAAAVILCRFLETKVGQYMGIRTKKMFTFLSKKMSYLGQYLAVLDQGFTDHHHF